MLRHPRFHQIRQAIVPTDVSAMIRPRIIITCRTQESKPLLKAGRRSGNEAADLSCGHDTVCSYTAMWQERSPVCPQSLFRPRHATPSRSTPHTTSRPSEKGRPALAAANTYDTAWMKSKIGTNDEKWLRWIVQLLSEPSSMNALRNRPKKPHCLPDDHIFPFAQLFNVAETPECKEARESNSRASRGLSHLPVN